MAGGKASKTKGSSGEREACKILGEIFGGSFIRAPNSGAFIGGKNVFRKQTLSAAQTRTMKGDIVPPDFMSKLVLECKSYGEFRFHQLMQNGTCPQLDEWIGQTVEVIDVEDLWFVIIKITRVGWFACVPDLGHAFEYKNRCTYKGTHGWFTITDMATFFRDNREAVLSLAA